MLKGRFDLSDDVLGMFMRGSRALGPPAIRQRVRWVRLAYLAICSIHAVAILWFRPYSAYAMASMILVVVAGELLARRVYYRRAAAVRAQDYKYCLNCGYSLRGLADEHVCPECGTAYVLTHVQEQWKRYLG